jgi:O-glycosyl hydrolase
MFRFAMSAAVLALAPAVVLFADSSIVDGSGRTVAMLHAGEEKAFRTNLVLPTPGWQRTLSLPSADGVTVTRAGSVTTYAGSIDMDSTHRLRFTQSVQEVDGKTLIGLNYTASGDLVAEGLYFRMDVPWNDFKNGVADYPGTSRSVFLSDVRPANTNIMAGDTSQIAVRDAAVNWGFSARLDRSFYVNLQDKSNESPRNFTFWIYLNRGTLPSGTTGSIQVELSLTGTPDTTPARLTLDASKVRYQFDGFGGNYCFQIESPVTQFTLNNLQVAWARTEMTLTEWEPTNDNGSPFDANWTFFEQHDQPNSNLRREFELAQQIERRGVQYIISIWHLPEWLYIDAGQQGPDATQRVIAPDKWDELLESIGTYLLYARYRYGIEPDLFSFNEPNLGINVLFTPEEHRDAIKRIGAHLQSLGLKTKMLLADVSHPRGTHTYAQPAVDDLEAMRYVGALSFHSWGGGTPDQYRAWGDLAEHTGLPLLVAEMGTDPSGWQGRTYDNYWYGLREVQHFQELLLYARPQGAIYWEFTNDYALVRLVSGVDRTGFQSTSRFWSTKQFTDLTPHHSQALDTQSDQPKVLFTAFSKGQALTLHIANLGAAREVAIYGIPGDVAQLRPIRTSETESYLRQTLVMLQDGVLRLSLPERSLVTLTNLIEAPPNGRRHRSVFR